MTTLRNWVYSRLSGNAELIALVGDRIYPTNAFGADSNDQIERPFIIYNLGLANTVHGTFTQPVQVWAHDEQGGMEVVDDILRVIRLELDDAYAIKLQGGGVIVECAHEGDSGDLYDDMLHTGNKFATFRVVYRP